MVSSSPAARKSRASPAPKVKTIEPEPDPVLSPTVAESAPPTTVLSTPRARARPPQNRIYPARRRHPERPDGRGHARARRVLVGEVDVGEGERAGGLDGLDGCVRTRGIRCQHRHVVAAGDGN